jgi:hypothetical protein
MNSMSDPLLLTIVSKYPFIPHRSKLENRLISAIEVFHIAGHEAERGLMVVIQIIIPLRASSMVFIYGLTKTSEMTIEATF